MAAGALDHRHPARGRADGRVFAITELLNCLVIDAFARHFAQADDIGARPQFILDHEIGAALRAKHSACAAEAVGGKGAVAVVGQHLGRKAIDEGRYGGKVDGRHPIVVAGRNAAVAVLGDVGEEVGG